MVKTRRGVGNIEVLEVDEPTVGPDQVMVEVKAAGICGTDIHIYKDEFRYKPPVVLGHEFCGVVADLGEKVEGFEIGDRVTCERT
ncbi:MAG: alcohol dehydrogenase catalytic domain-containing protein [Candidatus Geothermarchaeales archaeon]